MHSSSIIHKSLGLFLVFYSFILSISRTRYSLENELIGFDQFLLSVKGSSQKLIDIDKFDKDYIDQIFLNFHAKSVK